MNFKFKGQLFFNGNCTEEDMQRSIELNLYRMTRVHDVKIQVTDYWPKERKKQMDETTNRCITEEHLVTLNTPKAHLAAIRSIANEMMQEFVQDNSDSVRIVHFHKLQAILDIAGKVHEL